MPNGPLPINNPKSDYQVEGKAVNKYSSIGNEVLEDRWADICTCGGGTDSQLRYRK